MGTESDGPPDAAPILTYVQKAVVEIMGLRPGEDIDAWAQCIEEEPPPELLAKAAEAAEAQQRYQEWFDALPPEEQEAARARERDRWVEFILHGPGGD